MIDVMASGNVRSSRPPLSLGFNHDHHEIENVNENHQTADAQTGNTVETLTALPLHGKVSQASTATGVCASASAGSGPANDWEYAMRRDMQEIIPGLFLGPYAAAMKTKLEYLQRQGVTHIICIRQDIEANFVRPNFPDHFIYLTLDIADSLTENIIQHFPKVKEFLDTCLNNGGKTLIHGNGGISRSAALVIAYIMEKYNLAYKVALQYVQQRRFCISPNESFANQLKEYEPIYRAKLTLEKGQSSQVTGMLKRKLDEEDRTEDMETTPS